jgi:hypothetical protein
LHFSPPGWEKAKDTNWTLECSTPEVSVSPEYSYTSDVDIPPIHTTQPINQDQDTSSNINQGPLTRSRAKKLQQQVTSLLAEFDNNITENFILPKSYTLVIIRFKDVGCEDPQDVEEAYCMDDTCCQDRTTKSEHHHVNSDWQKETSISLDSRRLLECLSTQWKDNQVNFLIQQTAHHLDFPVKSNKCFTPEGSGAERTARVHFVVTLWVI